MNPVQFKIGPEGLKAVQKTLFIKALPQMAVAIVGGILIGYFNTSNAKGNGSSYLVILPLILIGATVFVWYTINQQIRLLGTYKLIVTETSIVREQSNLPKATIPIEDITNIIKDEERGIVIRGKAEGELILANKYLDDYDQLESLLSAIKPVVVLESKSLFLKYYGFLSLLVVGLMACLYLSQNKIVTIITGLILVTGLTYAFFMVRNNPSIDPKIKKGTWTWLLLILIILLGMYSKLAVK
jgi:hypothetical protein